MEETVEVILSDITTMTESRRGGGGCQSVACLLLFGGKLSIVVALTGETYPNMVAGVGNHASRERKLSESIASMTGIYMEACLGQGRG